jgi:hypothetical protein
MDFKGILKGVLMTAAGVALGMIAANAISARLNKATDATA